ncbi:MAG: hypothetical protein AABZ80_11050 [Gemmatimonadota bacterium]
MKRPPITWADSCQAVATALTGTTRCEIVDVLVATKDPLGALRTAMRRNSFETVDLERVVASLDSRSRKEGLHLVQAWDFGKHRFTDDSVPVLLLDYCTRLPSRKSDDRSAVAVLLDQYFITALSLLAVRAWDEGDANANLDRVTALLGALQGPDGSGHTFIDDAESLLFLAISYYHPDEECYGRLLAKVETLDARHQLRVATPCAGMMSAHLRWGLRFMYERDVGRMRDDNVVDYPWLSHAVAALAHEYARLGGQVSSDRATVAEALMLGLAADPWAFVGAMPPVLRPRKADHSAVREVLAAHLPELLAELETLRPSAGAYSPLAFRCNFPTNAAVAVVAVSLEDGRSYPPVNALFTSLRDRAGAEAYASRLMDYSMSDPRRLGAGRAPLIAYDPFDGTSAYNALVRELRSQGFVSGRRA